jgi:hypothetical protein
MTQNSLSPLLLEYGMFFVGLILEKPRQDLQSLDMWAQHVVSESHNSLAHTTMAAQRHAA